MEQQTHDNIETKMRIYKAKVRSHLQQNRKWEAKKWKSSDESLEIITKLTKERKHAEKMQGGISGKMDEKVKERIERACPENREMH